MTWSRCSSQSVNLSGADRGGGGVPDCNNGFTPVFSSGGGAWWFLLSVSNFLKTCQRQTDRAEAWARFPSGAWDKICCSSSDMSMIQAQGFWAWAANLVSNSTWKPGPGVLNVIVAQCYQHVTTIPDIYCFGGKDIAYHIPQDKKNAIALRKCD